MNIHNNVTSSIFGSNTMYRSYIIGYVYNASFITCTYLLYCAKLATLYRDLLWLWRLLSVKELKGVHDA